MLAIRPTDLFGAHTALISPFNDQFGLNKEALKSLCEFQIQFGITGILGVGTTGESPTLSEEEHDEVIGRVACYCDGKAICIGGTGSNNTAEAKMRTKHAQEAGVQVVLLVDPYYSCPPSMMIRKGYIAPVAKEFPNIGIMPYIIPARTGTKLDSIDLALLLEEYENIFVVKQATGSADDMRQNRKLCGGKLVILSGDDNMTYEMMTDFTIGASGVISVMSNVVPGAISEMIKLLLDGNISQAKEIKAKLDPLFTIVSVTTEEDTRLGPITCKQKNPLPVKALMNLLGMPAGPCRQPLGLMTRKGFEEVWSTARMVWDQSPDIFLPIQDFFNAKIDDRLSGKIERWEGLLYDPSYE